MEDHTPLLIRTKLQVPPSRPSLVERRRLLARLDLPEECGLTLISAPAGSGKTTLATQWLADSGLRAAWLSLDCADNDPERFAQHLIAALREVLPEALPTSLAMLASPATPPWPAITKTMTAELAAVRVKGPLVLVLDDLHTISAEPVQQLVRELVEALPPALHLVALTRHAPPWPLGRLRAQGRLRELSGPDLMFCFDEVRAFFATGDAPRLDEESLRLLHEKLEGWAAGLQLVRLSLEDSPDPGAGVRKLTGSQRMIASFLIEEVLAIQPPDVMEFLAATAPLGRFCAPLCDHVLRRDTAVPTARETISHLERENAFLIALDDDGCWFRYHRLFQELLLQQLEQRLGQEADRVPLQRAAEWFGSEGLTEEALQLWIASGDLDAAAQLLGKHLEAVLAEDLSRQVLRRWLHLFPSGSERGRLPLLVAHGYLASLRWDIGGIARLLDQAEQILATTSDAPAELRAAVDAQRCFQLYWQGDPQAALAHGLRALDFIAPRACGMRWAMATLYTAGSLARTGRREQAHLLLARATEEDAANGSHQAGALLVARIALDLYAGDVRSARARAELLLVTHNVRPLTDYWLAQAYYFLGWTAYECDHLEEAEMHFRAVERLRFQTSARTSLDAFLGRALVASASGERATALAHAAAAMEYAVACSDASSVGIAQALIDRLSGAADGARAARTPPLLDVDAMSFWLEVPSLTYAQALLARPAAEGDGALAYVERALEAAERGRNERLAIAFSLRCAMALDRGGDREAALTRLSAALRRAEPHRLVRTVLDCGPKLRELIVALNAREGLGHYAAGLLRAFDRREVARPFAPGSRQTRTTAAASSSATAADASPNDTSLTERELDVLELLAGRLSNKEIARQLFISGETVKTHLSAIYSKLGVHRRRDAVITAHARGLLSQRR